MAIDYSWLWRIYPLVRCFAVGVFAFVAGYGITVVMLIRDLGPYKEWNFANDGLFFFNMQFVDTERTVYMTPSGEEFDEPYVHIQNALIDVQYPGDLPPEGFVVVPIIVLVFAGIVVANRIELSGPIRYVQGSLIVFGYLPMVILGMWLFTTSSPLESREVATVPGLVLAGMVYPVVFGAVGSTIYHVTTGPTVQSVLGMHRAD